MSPDHTTVQLQPCAVPSILANQVENSRKYSPVKRAAPDPRRAEPIRVRTHRAKGRVHLEVADRGPGIPEAERKRVFDAFYRVGDERTRTTAGTGLGLHLVALQARAMKAKVAALPRPGGGSIFRVSFRAASR
jgi:signal transduction histidine kinase